MAINFPNNPNPNDTWTSGGKTWVYDGSTWKLNSTAATGIGYTDLSVVKPNPTASGSGDVTYNSSNGQFTYTPPVVGSTSFTGLSDTPGSFTAGKWIKVNAGGTALEWTDAPAGNVTYSIEALASPGIQLLDDGNAGASNRVFFDGLSGITVSRKTGTTNTIEFSASLALNDLSNVDATTNLANGKILKYDLGSTTWVVADDNASGGGSGSFTGLSDTPSAHSNNKWLKSDGSALIWTDAPSTYGDSDVDTHLNQSNPTNGHVLSWNGSDYAWVAQTTDTNTFTGLTGTPSSYTADKWLKVNAGGTALEYTDAPSGGGSGITIQEEGTSLSTAATTINFTGAKVTASGTGTTKTVNVATPTLAEVTTAGNSTTNNVTVNDLNVDGNLTVSGTTTTIDTATLNIADNILTLNSNYSGGSPTANAGIEVQRGTAPTTMIRWNETTDKWQYTNDGSNFSDIGSGGGSGTTNLGVTANGTSLTVTSDTGNDASIPAATTSAWGVMTDEDKTNLNANTLKVSNATHTGDVTGSTALTIANDAVTYAKMQNVSAESRILGRNVGVGAGNVTELNPTDVRTILNVANGAEANVQSDWTQTTTTADDYIKNKPTGLLTSVPNLNAVTGAGNTTSNAIEVGNCTVTGNLLVDGLVGISDDKITLNSDFSGSTPTANVDVVVERGNATDVRLRWNESTDKWTATNDGTNYFNISGFSGSYNDLTDTPGDANNYASSFSWNSGNGVLTLNRSGLSAITVDLDGRYATGTIPTNNNQLTNGANYITATSGLNVRTDSGNAYHNLLFVDSATDNQNQTLKMDNESGRLAWNPSANTLIAQAIASYRLLDWGSSYGSAGQVLTSQGSGQWNWTTPSSGGMVGNSKVTVKTSGNGTHTTQSWCKTIIVAMVGAGGGGGSAMAFYDDDDGGTTGYGGGGGSGGVAFYTNTMSTSTGFAYSVGTGGSAQSSGNCDDSAASGAAGTGTAFGGTTAGGGGGGQGVGRSGAGSGGSGGSGDLPGMAGGSGQDNNMRAITPFWGKYGYGGRGGDGTGLTGNDSGCNNGAESGENGAIIILELG